jgi:hypothetical protein
MPELAAWTLEFSGAPRKTVRDTNPTAEPKPDPARNQITIARDRTVRRISSEKSIGGNREAWVVGKSVFLLNGSRCTLVDASAFPGADFSHGDFEYFQWLRPTNCVGLVDFEGRKAFLFEEDSLKRAMTPRERANVAAARQSLSGGGELPELSLDSAEARPVQPPKEVTEADVLRQLGWGAKFRAWIDAATQRPLYLESGDLHIRVRYLPDPGALTLPPPILARLKAIQEEEARLARKPARPRR